MKHPSVDQGVSSIAVACSTTAIARGVEMVVAGHSETPIRGSYCMSFSGTSQAAIPNRLVPTNLSLALGYSMFGPQKGFDDLIPGHDAKLRLDRFHNHHPHSTTTNNTPTFIL
ncbi:hypothetical protein OPQ81_002134 [Rhizoctonia solani]|nr:hypothetical protein OPQ81_002134 [Rhizoctonia solani]